MTRYGIAINGHDAANAFYDYTKLKDSDGNIIGYSDDYERGNLLTRFRIHNNRYTDYSYDRLDRLSQAAFYNAGRTVYKSYYYNERANQPETGVKYKTTQVLSEYIDNTAYRFGYDDLGNITSVKTAGRTNPDTNNTAIGAQSEYRSYEYDSKSQLARENNATTNKTTVWTYDTLGNITSKTIYPYTTGELGTAESTIDYTYSNDGKTGWNYLLTGVGNDTITYDEIGNPTSYLGANLSWFGRKLQSYEKDGTSISYTYDANGMRAAKRVNGVKTEYLYLDGALRYEKCGTEEKFYLYDANGHLANIKHYQDGKIKLNIYVITNLQGDVVGLYDYLGVIQVSYEYDAWGNTVSVTDNSGANWNDINPFRYRGYYYDTDTGLYYLGSRYYNPEVGRFLNSDSILSTGAVLGFNNYAYCLNNPANMSDPSGNLPKWVRGAYYLISGTIQVAAGAALGAAAGWTGIGAVAAAVLIANGMGTAYQGAAQIGNSITNSNTFYEFNFARESAVTAGGLIGGETGEAIAGVLYDSAVTAASIYAAASKTSGCFISGTVILTNIGDKVIEKIEVGDMVWSTNEETGEFELKQVKQVFVHDSYELVHVFVGNEIITATPEHPFYVANIGWRSALKLRAGDKLVRSNGTYVIVEFVQHEILEHPVKVYNFEVDEFHTYHVGKNGLWVHNACKKPTSANQMNQQINRGQAPGTVIRVDTSDYSPTHIHFSDGTAVNIDGSPHDIGKGVHEFTKKELIWLFDNGWEMK